MSTALHILLADQRHADGQPCSPEVEAAWGAYQASRAGRDASHRIIPDPERMTCAPDDDDDLRWFQTSIDGNAAMIGYDLAGDEPIIQCVVFAGEVGPIQLDASRFGPGTKSVLIHAIRKYERFYS